MKKITYYILSLVFTVLLTGCLKDMKDEEVFKGSKNVEIGIVLPSSLSDLDKNDFKVTLRSVERNFSYVAYTDEDGKAILNAEYGSYTLFISKDIEAEGVIKFMRASQPLTLLKTDNPETKISVDIKASNKGTLILKEIYFQKSKIPTTGATYNYDQYFTIYNNSDKVQYLDGLGLGFPVEFNSSISSYYVKDWIPGSRELRDSVPVNAFGMLIPGKGTEHPLQPGGEVVIALSAINHTAAMTVTPIDLSTSDVWAMFIPNKTTAQKSPASTVSMMDCYYQLASGTQIVLSQISAAVVIYRIEGDPKEYVKEGPIKGRNYGNVMFKPTAYSSMPAIMIPKEWVYDGAEFRSADNHVARLCPEVSLQPLTISTKAGSATSYVRKVDEEATASAGHTIYKDTNNSEDDWTLISQPLRSKK